VIARRVIAAVLAAAATAIALAGCSSPFEQKQAGGTTIVLVGRSRSTDSYREALVTNATAVFTRAAKQGEMLTIQAIGDPPPRAGTPVDFRYDGPAKSNPEVAADQRKANIGTAHAQLIKVLEGAAPHHSNDVLSATGAAGDTLEHVHDDKPRYLVVLDDLHQIGSGVNFYDDRITKRYIRHHLHRLQEDLPDLTGVTVAFAGAGLDKVSEPFTRRREQAIARFWKAWGKRVHAKAVVIDSTVHLPAP
jgi:hypothetical protein